MPVYNAERYVAEAVESILAQTFADFEFLIIDDGSTDRSPAILGRLAAGDGRIRLLLRANRGICASRNDALALASGEFVAIMDADDVCLPRRLEIQVNYLRRDAACVAVGGMAEVIDPDGELIGRWDGLPTAHDEIDAANLTGQQSIIHSTLMARREAAVSLGGYRTNYSEDLDLLLRLAEQGQVVNLPDVLVRVRKHLTSATHARSESGSIVTMQVVEEARRRRGLDPLPPGVLILESPPATAVHLRSWAWGALGVGNLPTARKHALAAWRRSPLAMESWRVLYCSLRGR